GGAAAPATCVGGSPRACGAAGRRARPTSSRWRGSGASARTCRSASTPAGRGVRPVGDLEETDRRRGGPVQAERVPAPAPPPVRAGERIARALHLREG